MNNVQSINDISKETLTFLGFFDNSMIEKIPFYVITKLCEEAGDSKLDFYIDVNKSFEEQQISEKSKDLISLIYYDYIANEKEKKELLSQWNYNEKEYEERKKEKYSYENIFKNKKDVVYSTELVEVKKENIFTKILKLIRRVFSKREER